MGLSRTDLLGATALPCEEVTVPELGGTVWVQGMSGTDRDAYEASLWKERRGKRHLDLANLRARLLVRCVVDKPGGVRIFSESDVDALGLVRVDVLQRLFNTAQRLSGLSDEDLEELGSRAPTPEAGSDSPSS